MGCKLFIFTVLIVNIIVSHGHENKYSAKANMKKIKSEETTPSIDFRTLHRPFRMAKLNMLWTKAQIRLTEPKLKSLYSDLKLHDKEEIAFKHFKSEGGDKEGLKEAELRKKLIGIMSSFDLLEHFEDVHDKKKSYEHEAFNGPVEDHINKSLFKDKKLAKLWAKAELAGFTPEELSALKEEFDHHQDKIDQYYSILSDVEDGKKDDFLNAMNEDQMDEFNSVDEKLAMESNNINKDYLHKANVLREKHRELRDGYDRLYRKAARGPNSKDFVEPKVQGLWKLAIEGDFKPEELESLRVELLHYEARLLKLRHMQAEHASNSDKLTGKIAAAGSKPDGVVIMEENIKKQMRKVEKLHDDLHSRIAERHSEL